MVSTSSTTNTTKVRPGERVTSWFDHDTLRMKLILGENILTDRENAEIRYRMVVEYPYPDDAEMALYNRDDERGSDWIPVSQRTWPKGTTVEPPFYATTLWVRVGGELLHSRPFGVSFTGGTVSVEFPPTSWREYVERNSLPIEWIDDEVDM